MTTLEPLIYLLRDGPDHHRHGDPYQFSASVVRIGDTAHIYAASGRRPNLANIRDALLAAGFTVVEWERIDNGKVRTICIDLIQKKPVKN
jgi:hypothetical protein